MYRNFVAHKILKKKKYPDSDCCNREVQLLKLHLRRANNKRNLGQHF